MKLRRPKPRLACRLAAAALVWSALAVGAWAGPTVAIVKGTDPDQMVAQALELLGGVKQFVKDGQKVVIKPNLVWQPALDEPPPRGERASRPGLTTDVRIVRAVSRRMLQAARCRITVAEGTPNPLDELFEFLGYKKLAADLGIELVDVDHAERMTVKVDGLAHKEYRMPVVTQTADVLVDVAVMKTHHVTGVTLGMKNLFGLLPMPKRQFHAKVNEVLCDLSLMRKPDLVIVEALVALEGQGPVQGTPVRMDLLIAGRDVVAVDAVCTAIMGFDPNRVKYLKLAAGKGLGETDLKKITVKGLPIEKVRRPFRHARWEATVEIARTQALADKLRGLSDRGYKDARHGGMHLWFAPRHLKPDTAKYPTRESYGFTVYLAPDGDRIVFVVPYKVLFDENGQAAADEMARWIRDNLGKDIRMTKTPSRTPD